MSRRLVKNLNGCIVVCGTLRFQVSFWPRLRLSNTIKVSENITLILQWREALLMAVIVLFLDGSMIIWRPVCWYEGRRADRRNATSGDVGLAHVKFSSTRTLVLAISRTANESCQWVRHFDINARSLRQTTLNVTCDVDLAAKMWIFPYHIHREAH